MLLKAGAKIDSTEKAGRKIPRSTALSESVATVELLLTRKVLYNNAYDTDGRIALDLSKCHDQSDFYESDIAEMLVFGRPNIGVFGDPSPINSRTIYSNLDLFLL